MFPRVRAIKGRTAGLDSLWRPETQFIFPIICYPLKADRRARTPLSDNPCAVGDDQMTCSGFSRFHIRRAHVSKIFHS